MLSKELAKISKMPALQLSRVDTNLTRQRCHERLKFITTLSAIPLYFFVLLCLIKIVTIHVDASTLAHLEPYKIKAQVGMIPAFSSTESRTKLTREMPPTISSINQEQHHYIYRRSIEQKSAIEDDAKQTPDFPINQGDSSPMVAHESPNGGDQSQIPEPHSSSLAIADGQSDSSELNQARAAGKYPVKVDSLGTAETKWPSPSGELFTSYESSGSSSFGRRSNSKPASKHQDQRQRLPSGATSPSDGVPIDVNRPNDNRYGHQSRQGEPFGEELSQQERGQSINRHNHANSDPSEPKWAESGEFGGGVDDLSGLGSEESKQKKKKPKVVKPQKTAMVEGQAEEEVEEKMHEQKPKVAKKTIVKKEEKHHHHHHYYHHHHKGENKEIVNLEKTNTQTPPLQLEILIKGKGKVKSSSGKGEGKEKSIKSKEGEEIYLKLNQGGIPPPQIDESFGFDDGSYVDDKSFQSQAPVEDKKSLISDDKLSGSENDGADKYSDRTGGVEAVDQEKTKADNNYRKAGKSREKAAEEDTGRDMMDKSATITKKKDSTDVINTSQEPNDYFEMHNEAASGQYGHHESHHGGTGGEGGEGGEGKGEGGSEEGGQKEEEKKSEGGEGGSSGQEESGSQGEGGEEAHKEEQSANEGEPAKVVEMKEEEKKEEKVEEEKPLEEHKKPAEHKKKKKKKKVMEKQEEHKKDVAVEEKKEEEKVKEEKEEKKEEKKEVKVEQEHQGEKEKKHHEKKHKEHKEKHAHIELHQHKHFEHHEHINLRKPEEEHQQQPLIGEHEGEIEAPVEEHHPHQHHLEGEMHHNQNHEQHQHHAQPHMEMGHHHHHHHQPIEPEHYEPIKNHWVVPELHEKPDSEHHEHGAIVIEDHSLLEKHDFENPHSVGVHIKEDTINHPHGFGLTPIAAFNLMTAYSSQSPAHLSTDSKKDVDPAAKTSGKAGDAVKKVDQHELKKGEKLHKIKKQ